CTAHWSTPGAGPAGTWHRPTPPTCCRTWRCASTRVSAASAAATSLPGCGRGPVRAEPATAGPTPLRPPAADEPLSHSPELPRPGASGADSPDPAAPPGGSLSGVLRRAVERVRSRCAPASWVAFWQVVVEGRPPADVAGELSLSTNAVYIAVSRISGRLR